MRILLIHPACTVQLADFCDFLRKTYLHEIVLLTGRQGLQLPGVRVVTYRPSRQPSPQGHPYVTPAEDAVLQGQAAYRAAAGELKSQGFIPDVIYGYAGWGPTLYMKDLFPGIPLICNFEWFTHTDNLAFFFPGQDPTIDKACRIRTQNARIVIDLYSCDLGITPTYYQKSKFPPEYAEKIKVLHDGVNTQLYRPKRGYKLVLPEGKLDCSQVAELVTYVVNGQEHYSGYRQFMEAASIIQRRPKCHILVCGAGVRNLERKMADGKTYKQHIIDSCSLDINRIHFLDDLPAPWYSQIFQASTVHVYLTEPFFLSFSLLEAMSCGCALVASNTPPVKEMLLDGVNGLLADMQSPQDIANKIEELLDHPGRREVLAVRARECILERYDTARVFPEKLKLFTDSQIFKKTGP
ncbi:MAG TPA: glycosyltransferase [Methylomusa anaerophila]|uniref:D-inositol-3-phosphate glycosyltransferase n=1 Tax=Methylomusa anaerophila TaxID=1930071 RepID=A0A348AKQ9_9FIRM|nr:glycosyltransferase [Methylomusa anaerophila]BBB91657.1 D-inositol-3-phosphate glycosyltransferase [Methylomusa anaerophila]HML88609.1 glycosyltransferase [Methylomusa anaerophila]